MHSSEFTSGEPERRKITRRSSDITENRLLYLDQVIAICALGRTSVYDAVKEGNFPAPVHILGRTPRWIHQEIQDWLASRIKASRKL
jgi:prophage regulatory protein